MSKREKLYREILDRNDSRWRGIARIYAAPDSRDDLLQEILMQIWQSLDQFSGRSHVDTWAYRVAINTALAWVRAVHNRENCLPRVHVDVAELGGDQGSSTVERHVLDEFMASLSLSDRTIMLLYLDDVPNREACEILGLSEGTLRVRMHRIRKRFESLYCNPVETK